MIRVVKIGSKEIEIKKIGNYIAVLSQKTLPAMIFFKRKHYRTFSLERFSAFSESGWTLYTPIKINSGYFLPNNSVFGEIFEMPDNSWGIVTNNFILKLKDDLKEEEAQRFIKDYKIDIIRTISFVPYLYDARLSETIDVFDFVLKLNELPEVVYAEHKIVYSLSNR